LAAATPFETITGPLRTWPSDYLKSARRPPAKEKIDNVYMQGLIEDIREDMEALPYVLLSHSLHSFSFCGVVMSCYVLLGFMDGHDINRPDEEEKPTVAASLTSSTGGGANVPIAPVLAPPPSAPLLDPGVLRSNAPGTGVSPGGSTNVAADLEKAKNSMSLLLLVYSILHEIIC
jgi:hypothetical protein